MMIKSSIAFPFLLSQLSFTCGRNDFQHEEIDRSNVYDPNGNHRIAVQRNAPRFSLMDSTIRSLSSKSYLFQQVGSDIDGESRSDRSGYSVAMSDDGKRVVVGAPYNDHNGWDMVDSGHARIYEEVNSTWVQVGEDIDGGLAYDKFGWSIGMNSDGKRVIVGSAHSDESTGYVRVYEEQDEKWRQVGMDIIGDTSMTYSGYSTDISGDGKHIIIGTIYSNGPAGDKSGHATIYTEKDGEWLQVGPNIDGSAKEENSGYDVAISADGMRVIIGSLNPPFARVFGELNGDWVQIGENIEGPKVGISADGKRVVAGSKTSCGIYEEANGKWVNVGNLFEDPPKGVLMWPDYAISSNGKSVIMGFPWKGEWGRPAGTVLVYQEEDGGWAQVGEDIVGEDAIDQAGTSVSISADGMRVLVGAPYNTGENGEESGHVRVFELVEAAIKEEPDSSSSGSNTIFTAAGVGVVSAAVVLLMMD